MKKTLITLLLAWTLLLGAAALAEEDTGTVMNCLIEEGSYIIQIDDPEGDLAWVAESGDEEYITLYLAELIEDTFVVRFDPVQDGDVTVFLSHYTGIACDKLYSWDLHIEGNAVTECASGSAMESLADEVSDPLLLGEWIQKDDESMTLSVEKNPVRGWDVEIVSPLAQEAYIFKTTIYCDIIQGFVYDKGKFWDLPAEKGAELGEARTAGSVGLFVLDYDEETSEVTSLIWYDDALNEDTVFVRAEG